MQPRLLHATLPIVLSARLATVLGREQQLLRRLTQFMFFNAGARGFGRYVPGPQDVFVATFAKSGTNWAMQLAVQIAWRGAAEFDHIHELVPWPEAPDRQLASIRDDDNWRRAPTQLRAIKTHLPPNHLPWLAAGEPGRGERYLCVIRDPKEMLVSAYPFLLGTLGIRHRISPARWLDINLAPNLLITAWAVHTASCWALREREDAYVVIYDQLKSDFAGHVDAIARFMGVTLTEHERAAVLERCSLAYMKANEPRFAPLAMALQREDQWPVMIRRGQAGDSGELYDAEQRGRIDTFARAELQRLGSAFPYDEWFGRG